MTYLKLLIFSIVLLLNPIYMSSSLADSSNINEKLSELQKAYDNNELKKAENISLNVLKILNKEKYTDLNTKEKSTNIVLITVVLNKLNGIYKKTHNLELALEYILKAYSIAKKEQDFPKEMISMYTYNLANTYGLLENYEKARYSYEEALDMSLNLLKSEKEKERGYAQFILPNATEKLIEIYHDLGLKNKIPELHKKIDGILLESPL